MFIKEDLELALDMAASHVGDISYTSPAVRTVGVLTSAVSHAPTAFGHVPRIQITGEYGSGKSTFLSALQSLIQNPSRHTGQGTTRYALRNVFRDASAEGLVPALIIDETKHIFGPTGKKDGGPLYSILTDGYDKAGSPVTFQEKDENKSYSAYQVAFLAGRGERSLPEDVIDRCIRVTLAKKPENMRLADKNDPAIIANGETVGAFLASSVKAGFKNLRVIARDTDWHGIHGLTARDADKWVPLFAMAQLAGGNWPELVSAAYAELGSKNVRNLPPSLQIKVDIFRYIEQGNDPERVTARDLIEHLSELGRSCYKFDGDPFSIRMWGLTIKQAGAVGFKSNSTLYYQFSDLWVKQARTLANPVITEARDPENEWSSIDDLFE
jgi:energy-coupling factor transporter ATP-binding protein EcfA2